MYVNAQWNYSHGYFVTFPRTGVEVIAHMLEFPIKTITLRLQ